MKAAEKKYQKLNSSQNRSANAKYNVTRWKISASTINEYLDFLEDEAFYEIDK